VFIYLHCFNASFLIILSTKGIVILSFTDLAKKIRVFMSDIQKAVHHDILL